MSLETLRAAVVNTIGAGMTSTVTCEPHGGRFDVEELKRVSRKTPAVFVAVLGLRDVVERNGDFQATVAWGAFAVAKDNPGLRRDLAAAALVDRLTMIVPDNTWGLEDECLRRPQGIRGDNLFSASVNKLGVAMWAVTWQQSMVLGQAMDDAALAALDPFETLNIRYPVDDDVDDHEDAPEAVDQVTLPQDGA